MRILLRGRLFICSAVASAGDGRGGQPLPCAIRHDKGMAKGVVEEDDLGGCGVNLWHRDYE